MTLKFLLIIFIVFSTKLGIAQQKKSTSEIEQKKLESFFIENIPWNFSSDSTKFYAFAFEVVVKKEGNKSRVISITSRDSVAFNMYPKYKMLENINYSVFMKGRNQAVFIIPVALSLFDSKKVGWGKGIDPSKNYLSLFSYKPDEFRKIEDYIYFKPFVGVLD